MDQLVRLYDLPDPRSRLASLAARGILIRRARAYERSAVASWVAEQFSRGWADECEVSFAREPLGCHIAIEGGAVIGFACHETTQRNFFGPLGVASGARGSGVGAALLLTSLEAMAALGYAYAIIGGVTTAAPFYRKVVGAIDIPGSTPGIYAHPLRANDS